MKFKFEKNLRIADELMIYFHKLGANDIQLNMKEEKNSCIFITTARVDKIEEEKLTNLINTLNTKRQHEIEEHYWNLLSESELDNELSIVGMMIDKAEVEYKDSVLRIKLYREN
jgi:hypothetical protein